MTRTDQTGLPFESSDKSEQDLWNALQEIPLEDPSSQLRRRFYNSLHEAASPSIVERFAHWLGMRSNGGWVTIAACLAIGFGVAHLTDQQASEPGRLLALEENLASLQRELILDRLQDTSASTRLRGVVEASQLAPNDQLVAQALLDRATQDRSISVRSAAIDALGSQITTREVGQEVMQLLEEADSPIVQLALVDLVLRHGSAQQLDALQELADSAKLHPDLVQHVNRSLRSQSI